VRTADARDTEPIAAVRAARFLVPGATMVVDIGMDETLVATIKADGKIEQELLNQKCAAGLGILLERIAARLGLTLEEMGAVDVTSAEPAVNDGCVVFAELDALSLLNRGTKPRKWRRPVTERPPYGRIRR
jgi:activator of 2-hydroxyglutaryl-CoA dehydratase